MHRNVVFLAYPCYTLVLTVDFLDSWKRERHLRKTQNCHLLLVPTRRSSASGYRVQQWQCSPSFAYIWLVVQGILKKKILGGIPVLKWMNWIKTSTPVLKKLNIIVLTYTYTEKPQLLCFDLKICPSVLELDGVCLFLPMLKSLIFWVKKQPWNKKESTGLPALSSFCTSGLLCRPGI